MCVCFNIYIYISVYVCMLGLACMIVEYDCRVFFKFQEDYLVYVARLIINMRGYSKFL